MRVVVERVEPAGSVSIGVGVDEEGRRVRFAGDWRPMRDVALALDRGEYVLVDLEAWQVLGHEG